MVTGILAKDRRIFATTLKEARIGHREAQYEVALMYANGVGVEQDIAQAVHWIRQSAERGLAAAQYLLANRHIHGTGVESDEHKALQWYLKAAEQGHAKAMFRMGRFYETLHHEAALAMLSKAADLGLADAQFALATELESSDSGGEQAQRIHGLYLLAARQGVAAAQCALGDRYANGVGVGVDLGEAMVWYRKAAHQSYPRAQVMLAMMDSNGNGNGNGNGRSGTGHRKHRAERRRDEARWAHAGDVGDADVKYNLGLMYEMGLAVEPDLEQAQQWYVAAARFGHAKAQLALAKLFDGLDDDACLHWYQKAAEQEEPDAYFAMGKIYTSGQGVDRSALQGMRWYMNAIAQDDPRALMTVGQLFHEDLDGMAEECFLRAANQGVAEAQFLLGNRLESSADGGLNLDKALKWYLAASKQGHVQSQSALGAIYFSGRLGKKYAQKAAFWLEKAADQGDLKATWNLSLVLLSGGTGIKKDLPAAFLRCKKAAEAGFVPAQATLGVMYARMKKHERALEWWAKAANQGDPEAQFNFANALSNGQGIIKDAENAFEWFLKAALRGVVPAQSRIGLLYATGEGVVLDPIEAHKWFVVADERGDKTGRANRLKSESQLDQAQLVEARRRASLFVNSSVPSFNNSRSDGKTMSF